QGLDDRSEDGFHDDLGVLAREVGDLGDGIDQLRLCHLGPRDYLRIWSESTHGQVRTIRGGLLMLSAAAAQRRPSSVLTRLLFFSFPRRLGGAEGIAEGRGRGRRRALAVALEVLLVLVLLDRLDAEPDLLLALVDLDDLH